MTTFEDGTISLVAAGFTDVEYTGDNIALGMLYIKDSISEHLLTDPMMPIIPSVRDIILAPNQMIIQLSA